MLPARRVRIDSHVQWVKNFVLAFTVISIRQEKWDKRRFMAQPKMSLKPRKTNYQWMGMYPPCHEDLAQREKDLPDPINDLLGEIGISIFPPMCSHSEVTLHYPAVEKKKKTRRNLTDRLWTLDSSSIKACIACRKRLRSKWWIHWRG